MQQVFIQHAQDQIQGEQGKQYQPWLGFQRLLKRVSRAGKTGAHRHRQVELSHGLVDGLGGLRQRHARRQAEAEGVRGHATFMRHRQSGVGELDAGKAGKGHGLAFVVDELQAAQRLGALQIRRGQLHHHTVLVQGVVDDADLALAESIGQDGVNGSDRQAQASCRVTVNQQRGLQAAVLVVVADVFQFFELTQGAAQFGLPFAQLRQIIGFDAELVLGIGRPGAHPNILHRR